MKSSPRLISFVLSLGLLVSCDRLALITSERASLEAEYVALVAEQQSYDRQINTMSALGHGGPLEHRANAAAARAAMFQTELVRYAKAISEMEASKKIWRARLDEFKALQNH